MYRNIQVKKITTHIRKTMRSYHKGTPIWLKWAVYFRLRALTTFNCQVALQLYARQTKRIPILQVNIQKVIPVHTS